VARLRSPADIAYAEQRRTVIASAPVEVVERDGRAYRLVKLPAPSSSPVSEHPVRAHALRQARRIA
jgi:hypothetical protein